MPDFYVYLIIMAGITYLIRVLPVTLIQKQIQNRFIQSFLYYVPYVTLAVMTVPSIFYATQVPAAGVLALFAGIIAAWLGGGLFHVAASCCITVLIIEFFFA